MKIIKLLETKKGKHYIVESASVTQNAMVTSVFALKDSKPPNDRRTSF